MLFHRMWEPPDRHCCPDCSALRVSRPFLLHDQRETRPAAAELCEECRAIIIEDAVDRLLELESRIVETKAKLKSPENRPLYREAVREHINVLKTSLQVTDEYQALLFTMREKDEP
jgi:hypothetical protein